MTDYTKPITEIIRQRYSCRSYIPKPIERSKRLHLAEFGRSLADTSNETRARFELAAASEADLRALDHLGTYGFVQGASGFMIGAISSRR